MEHSTTMSRNERLLREVLWAAIGGLLIAVTWMMWWPVAVAVSWAATARVNQHRRAWRRHLIGFTAACVVGAAGNFGGWAGAGAAALMFLLAGVLEASVHADQPKMWLQSPPDQW